MSLVARQRSIFKQHISVKCPCGRSLRAKIDQAGEQIKCWDCHAMVAVPIPRQPGWVARALQSGLKEALSAHIFLGILAGACLVAAILMLPGYGLYTACPIAAIGVAAYGLALRDASHDERSAWTREHWLLQVWRLILCLGIGALLVVPWIVYKGGIGDPPRFTRLGTAALLISCLVLPLVLLGSFARDIQGRAGFGLVFKTLIRHPFATFSALCLLPLSLVGIELLITGLMRYQEVYPFFLLDLFPKPDGFLYNFSLPYYNGNNGWVEHMALPMSYYENLHSVRLNQGYSLIMGLVGSITLGTDNGFNPWGIYLTPRGFGWLRFFYTLVIVLGILTSLAIQAHWLGLLSTLSTRRTVS